MAENITRITNLNDEQMATIAEFFKVFGDYTRVRVLAYLFDTCLLYTSLQAALQELPEIESSRLYCR